MSLLAEPSEFTVCEYSTPLGAGVLVTRILRATAGCSRGSKRRATIPLQLAIIPEPHFA